MGDVGFFNYVFRSPESLNRFLSVIYMERSDAKQHVRNLVNQIWAADLGASGHQEDDPIIDGETYELKAIWRKCDSQHNKGNDLRGFYEVKLEYDDETSHLVLDDHLDEHEVPKGNEPYILLTWIGSVNLQLWLLTDGDEAFLKSPEGIRVSEQACNEIKARQPTVCAQTTVIASVVDLGDGVALDLIWIPPGTFIMGSPDNEPNRSINESPAHQVTISTGFWMGKCEVTQAQYKTLMGNNPSEYKGNDLPVEKVSWNQAMAFCEKLKVMLPTEMRSNIPRLPTEAEWEYACRAGTTDPFAGALDSMGWHQGNSKGKPHKVGQKQPNGWGMYDMHGNVAEWCLDWNGDYAEIEQEDPQGPTTGSAHVIRGGGYLFQDFEARSATRNFSQPDDQIPAVGFRVAIRAPIGSDVNDTIATRLGFTETPKEVESDPSSLASSAQTHMKQKRYEEALRDATSCLELEPDNAFALRTRAETQLYKKQYEEALRDVTRSLEIDPHNAEGLRIRAMGFFKLGQMEEALRDVSRSLEFDPNNAEGLQIRQLLARQPNRTIHNTAPQSPVPVSKEQDDIPKQLKALKDLKDSGILTEEEYQAKRKILVDKL